MEQNRTGLGWAGLPVDPVSKIQYLKVGRWVGTSG